MPKLDHDQRRSQICLIHFRKIKKNGKLLKSNKDLHKPWLNFIQNYHLLIWKTPGTPVLFVRRVTFFFMLMREVTPKNSCLNYTATMPLKNSLS